MLLSSVWWGVVAGLHVVISTGVSGLLDKGCWVLWGESRIWGFDDCFHRHSLLELRKYHTLLLLVSDCLLYEVESAPGKLSSVRSYFSTVFWFVSLVWFLFPCIIILVVIFLTTSSSYLLCHILVLIHLTSSWSSGSFLHMQQCWR